MAFVMIQLAGGFCGVRALAEDVPFAGSAPNSAIEQIARGYYEAAARGTLPGFLDRYATDAIVYHVPARNALGGEYRGKAAVLNEMAALQERSGNTFRLDVADIASSPRHAVGIVTAKAQHEGKMLESKQTHVFEIRDGRITDIWIYAHDRSASEEFWR